MSNITLFEIGKDIERIEEVLSEMGGEITDERVEQMIDEWLAESKANLQTKMDSYAALIKEFEARADIRKKEADNLLNKVEQDRRNVKRLKERLRYFFERYGITKVETNRSTVSLRRNGGQVPLKILVDPEILPQEYQKIKVIIEADKEKIRFDLETGKELNFAELGDRGNHIAIK